ncbi:MAG TPA: hypothetical protein DCE23_09655 [Firmicutes bacterium]|nr:hypothetical protein [Bacillota bacterium]
MEQGKLKIKENKGVYTLEKDEKKVIIWQTEDKDICFCDEKPDTPLEFDLKTENYLEGIINDKFKWLMISILGRYLLVDAGDKKSSLPNDFVDLRNKTITWHSDNENTLQLSYDKEAQVMRLSIIKGEKTKSPKGIVKIKADASAYQHYSHFFQILFNDLDASYFFIDFASKFNPSKDEENKKDSPETPQQPPQQPRKLSLKRLFGRKKQ